MAKIIKIVLMNDVPTLWNEYDCNFIRTQRIMGTLVGPLSKSVHQNSQFGLPLRLMKEEAYLLVDKGLAILVELPELSEDPSKEMKTKYNNLFKIFNEEQFYLSYEGRKMEIIKRAQKILEGKKIKLAEKRGLSSDLLAEELTLEIVIQQEVNKIKSTNENSQFIEIHMEHPLIPEIPSKSVVWTYPETAEEKLCCAVFKDLWNKGYYITSGIKFGGDYLVYEGNSDSYHASFIVKCVNDNEEIYPCDLTTWIRVATVTKKTLVIASMDEDNKIYYQSFHWAGELLPHNFSSM